MKFPDHILLETSLSPRVKVTLLAAGTKVTLQSGKQQHMSRGVVFKVVFDVVRDSYFRGDKQRRVTMLEREVVSGAARSAAGH